MERIIAALGLLCLATLPALASGDAGSPYAGQDRHAIKALSPADIADLLAGRGWGFAKPAELNGYPGPAHLLEFRDRLDLSDRQVTEIERLFEQMQQRAIALGEEYVAAERALDMAFGGGTVAPDTLAPLVQRAAELKGRLRLVHLETHLATLPLLTQHQIVTYRRLRGYDTPMFGHRRH
ncbi:MAG: hypothetical protein WD767_14845 [Alphaproteobacteria bacterium]